MNEEDLRRDLLIAFEYSYMHDDWVTPLEEALQDLSAKDALRRPSAGSKGIWDIVLHLAVWHEDMVARIETGQKSRPAEGAWPPPPNFASEEAWDASKARLWNALDSVKQCIETTPIEKILNSPYGLPDLLCRFTHNGYHIGQITKLTEELSSSKNAAR